MLAQGASSFKQAVQLAALAEHRCFGGIEVFGFFIAQHAAAKTDAFALDVADGKHDPIAETVVAFGFTGRILVVGFAGNDQAAFNQQRVVIVRKHAGQAAPAFRGIAEAKGFGDFARNTAPLEILNRPF